MLVPMMTSINPHDRLDDVHAGTTFVFARDTPHAGEIFIGVTGHDPAEPGTERNFVPCCRLSDGRLFAFPKDWPCRIIAMQAEEFVR